MSKRKKKQTPQTRLDTYLAAYRISRLALIEEKELSFPVGCKVVVRLREKPDAPAAAVRVVAPPEDKTLNPPLRDDQILVRRMDEKAEEEKGDVFALTIGAEEYILRRLQE